MATCDGPECEREAVPGGRFCAGHYKQHSRGQPLTPLRSYASTWDRLVESAISFVDADSDDDLEFKRAKDALAAAARAYKSDSQREAIRAGIARARAKGIRVGRPRSAEYDQVRELVKRLGIRGAARAMGLPKSTVWNAVKGVRKL